MNYNIYFSPTGGTKKVADILVSNLNGEFCGVDISRDIESMTLQADDVCLVFGAFSAAQKGLIENFIFVNPSDTRGFRARKKPVE